MPPRQLRQPLHVVLDPEIVMARVGLDEAAILAGVNAGTFPKPIKVDGRVVWKEPDIQEWVTKRIEAGDEAVIALHQLSPAHERLIDLLAAQVVREHREAQRKKWRRADDEATE